MPLTIPQQQVIQDIARAHPLTGDAMLSRQIVNAGHADRFRGAGTVVPLISQYYSVLNKVRRERGTNRYGKSNTGNLAAKKPTTQFAR